MIYVHFARESRAPLNYKVESDLRNIRLYGATYHIEAVIDYQQG